MGRPRRIEWWKWVLLLVLAGPLTFIVIANLIVFTVGGWGIEDAVEAVPPADIALILGAGPGSGAVQERLLAGIALWEAERVGFLLVSGGGDGTAYSEIAYMERFLRHHGVPGDAIIVDPYGLRTLDSVLRTRDVIGARRVILVTQRYHLYRALFLARIAGFEARGLAAVGGPQIDSRQVLAREFFARVQAVLDTLRFRPASHPDAPAGTDVRPS